MSELDARVYNRIILLILGIPVLFLLLFTVVSVQQLREINARIEEGQSLVVKEMVSRNPPEAASSESYRQFLTLAVLEEESLNERYRQGHYSLVSRSFKQFLGFFTGIIMVIVGCVFVLLKLREDIKGSGAQGMAWKFSLVTNSPGVVFGIVGAVLISIAATTNDKINIRDSGLYLTREYLVAPYFTGKEEQTNLDEFMRRQAQNQPSDADDSVTAQPPRTPAKNKTENNGEEIKIQHPPPN